MTTSAQRFNVNASWLIKLRWVAVIGQVVTILTVTKLFGIEIKMGWALGVVIGVTIISNLLLIFWHQNLDTRPDHDSSLETPSNLVLGMVMIMDMLSLTCLLFATGGPNNPFTFFFFVNLSLCALILDRNWAWALNVLSIVCYAGLLLLHYPIEQLDFGNTMEPILRTGTWSIPQAGLLVGFSTCASVIVYFMNRLTDELREQEIDLRIAQEIRSRAEKLEALGTLAAGTAHELATPLSTIAIVARDVEKAFDEHPPEFPGAEDVIEDVHLIRSQLDRCRSILDRMAVAAGQAIGESLTRMTVKDLVDEVLRELPEHRRVDQRIKTAYVADAADGRIRIPLVGLSQSLRGLVQNALDSDTQGKSVYLNISVTEKDYRWVITDQGTGMDASVLQRVSEPFFTTKPTGKGMGLGVFLAKNVIQRLGGSIAFESELGKGTEVTIILPLDNSPVSEKDSH